MASLATIRTTLKDTIAAAIDSLQCYETVPEAVNTPAAVIIPRATDFQRAFGRGLDAYTFDVIVVVSRSDDQLAQDVLDPYVNGSGSDSVRQAIWDARATLLAAGIDASVTGMTDYGGTYTIGSTDYAGARLAVEVLTSGTA